MSASSRLRAHEGDLYPIDLNQNPNAMTFRRVLRCSKCKTTVMTESAAGHANYQEFAFPCPKCGVELRFGINFDSKNAGVSYASSKSERTPPLSCVALFTHTHTHGCAKNATRLSCAFENATRRGVPSALFSGLKQGKNDTTCGSALSATVELYHLTVRPRPARASNFRSADAPVSAARGGT